MLINYATNLMRVHDVMARFIVHDVVALNYLITAGTS